jgi:hypothetical protein
VALFSIVTREPGTAAPLVSVTVPRKEVSDDCAQRTEAENKKKRNSFAKTFM